MQICFLTQTKNRKLAKNGQVDIFMLWYFGEKKKGLCIGMAMLPFQKYTDTKIARREDRQTDRQINTEDKIRRWLKNRH